MYRLNLKHLNNFRDTLPSLRDPRSLNIVALSSSSPYSRLLWSVNNTWEALERTIFRKLGKHMRRPFSRWIITLVELRIIEYVVINKLDFWKQGTTSELFCWTERIYYKATLHGWQRPLAHPLVSFCACVVKPSKTQGEKWADYRQQNA